MIKTIAHLADIHIRKLHRFVEYRQVFKKLYKQLKDLKPDVIYIGGDVVHGKLDTSPEEVRMVANFFLNLCKIAPTIVIPDIAFEPDINGVWRVGGTFVITSKPTKIAKIKIYNWNKISDDIIISPSQSFFLHIDLHFCLYKIIFD